MTITLQSKLAHQDAEKRNILWMSESGQTVIIERMPEIIVIDYYDSLYHQMTLTEVQTFRIPMPRMVYGFVFDSPKREKLKDFVALAAKINIKTGKELLYQIPLPNVGPQGWVDKVPLSVSGLDLDEQLYDAYMKVMWDEPYTNDQLYSIVTTLGTNTPPTLVKQYDKTGPKNAAYILKNWMFWADIAGVKAVSNWNFPAARFKDDSHITFNGLIEMLARREEGVLNGR